MTRITHVKSARKHVGTCGKCGAEIAVGMSYSWLSFRFGGRRVRCGKPECRFKRSDTTQSKLSSVYAAQESAQDELAKWDRKDADALRGIVESLAESVREVHDEYEEAAEQHPNLAGQTEDIRSELDGIASDLEGFDVADLEEGEDVSSWADRAHAEADALIERVSEV